MEQYTDNQYDDDLTVETDQYDEAYYTDADDIFDLSTDEESPIGRLKSLILSIDWEITDEVLLQFNEELLDLRDIWAGEKVNLIYIQALEKISKYIYQKKADSHPNAIKLLLTLYHNLEKIVSSPDLSESEKNAILLEDVKRFEGLKKIIARKVAKPVPVGEEQVKERPEVQPVQEEDAVQTIYSSVRIEELTNLKAIVLGIDWEIRDEDLEELHQEVGRLEKLYIDSKPRLILLQGIGTLGTYIRLKKSNAHANAFKVLQFFYESLEKIVATPMSREQEKEILFPAVEMFNSFKTQLGPTISPGDTPPIPEEDEEIVEEESAPDSTKLAPALSSIAADEAMGFQAEEEARRLPGDNFTGVDTHVDGFFKDNQWDEEDEEEPEDQALEEDVIPGTGGINFDDIASPVDVDKETALLGVNVEEDDEEDELDAGEQFGVAEISERREDSDTAESGLIAGISDDVAPAPTDTEDSDLKIDLQEDAALREDDDTITTSHTDEDPLAVETSPDVLLDEEPELNDITRDSSDAGLLNAVDEDDGQVLAGVDVYSEADDDSDEEPLPVTEGDLAPALSAAIEEDVVTDEDEFLLPGTGEVQTEDEILSRVEGFFIEPEDPVADDHDFAEPEQLTEVTQHEAVVSGEQSQEGRGEELVADEGVHFEKKDLAEVAFGSKVTGDPVEEMLSFVDDDTESPGFLSDDTVDLPKVNENLELEESIEAFFADTSETESFEEELETEVDTDPEEFQDQLPGALPETDELEIDIDPEVENYSHLADEESAVSIEQADEAEVETVEHTFVPSVPAFKLATPRVKVAGLVEEVDRQPSDSPGLSEESGEELLAPETIELDEQVSPSEAIEELEEEVVFELAEEGDDPIDISQAVEPVKAVSTIDEGSGIDIQETVEEFSLESNDPLSDLQLCIDSLGFELDDKVFTGVHTTINRLRNSFTAKPVEKTFVELIATITQHIEKHRPESSDRAHTLLRSVFEALNCSSQNDLEVNQEQLFKETCKVLNWQQDMLGEKLTYDTPTQESDDDVLIEFDEAFVEFEKQNSKD